MNTYQVKLDAIDFEGPLDLLLHLIRKNEINIYDIPISFILKEYLVYLQALQEIDVQVSSEFLAMAGKLMFIKSRMLLPSQWLDEDPNDPWFQRVEDPRAELVRQLENRKRLLAIRDALDDLRTREFQAFYTYRRGNDPAEMFPPTTGNDLGELTLTDLLSNYERTIARAKIRRPIEMRIEPINIRMIIREFLGRLKSGLRTLFNTLVGEKASKARVVTAFLAILELCKDERIMIHQKSYNSPIEVERI